MPRLAFIVIFSLLSFLRAFAIEVIRVVDAEDSQPIPYATIFSQTGTIIGLTDDNGAITIDDNSRFPVTIKCMGYEPLQCAAGTCSAAMTRCAYPLEEVVVSPADRPVTHIICYFREYVSGESGENTIISFNEHMGDFFLTDGKVKGFKSSGSPRFLCSRLYSRVTDSSGLDSIFRPDFRDTSISWEQLINFPSGRVEIKSDTVAGKYGIKEVVRRDGELISIHDDYLADNKDHRLSPMIFKLLGFTMDITEFQSNKIVRPSAPASYSAADILSATFTFDITGRGKWIKKAFRTDAPVHMYGYYEIYPVEIEHLTVEDAKELQKNPPTVKMQVSPLAGGPEPAVQYIIDHCRK
ncbi:MAG: carboxypeptidase-like regulatory domain-containing protein [Muribaculaceae bacterium]|nr:carboxypeptidase-like regulatory domain-containing protein [Muribaculaceae bacterium]